MLKIKVLLLILVSIDVILCNDDDPRSQTSSGPCPSPDEIKPCTCDGSSKSLRCFSTIEFDLEQVFKAIVQGKSEEDKAWTNLEISSPLISEMKDSIFHGLSFKTVKFLHCNKLNCISPTAFYGMERTIENFIGYDTSFSFGDKPGCNLFDSLRRLINLRAINITGSRIREIPENAFHETSGSHAQLTVIDLSGNQGGEITKVGRNAFASLKALKLIDLSLHQISKVSSHAFYFEDSSSDFLTINLESNLLTSESFESESFATNGRITTVKLGGNPNLQALKEPVWRSFLLNTGRSNPAEQNLMDLRGSPISCNKQNLWVLENKFKLQRKIIHVISAESGLEFWKHTPTQCDKDKLLGEDDDSLSSGGSSRSNPNEESLRAVEVRRTTTSSTTTPSTTTSRIAIRSRSRVVEQGDKLDWELKRQARLIAKDAADVLFLISIRNSKLDEFLSNFMPNK